MTSKTTFAVPGNIDTLTGGYIYEKQVLLALRRKGWNVTHLSLPDSFPHPTEQDTSKTAEALASLAPDEPVILDGFLTGAMPPAQLARLRAPFIAITHHPLAFEAGLSSERATQLKQVERANLARAAHVVVPSRHTAKTLITHFNVPAKRITIAAPGVLRPDLQSQEATQQPHILAVGQLVPRKGHNVLLDALAQIKELDWSAQIVGAASDPEYARRLEQQIADLQLNQRVELTALLPPEMLSARYATATLFALATQYEGYGMVFAEAMVHGLPIVSCDGGAVRDTVPTDAGLLVRVGDAAAFSGALHRLLTDNPLRLRLARASAEHGRGLPTWDDTAKAIGEVLEALCPQS